MKQEILRLQRAIREDGDYAAERKIEKRRSKRVDSRNETAKRKHKTGKRRRKG